MALAKHAEEIQEKIEENMAMRRYIIELQNRVQVNTAKTAAAQNSRK